MVSRLDRHEQQKLVKQTVIFAVAAVVLLLLFLFVILPQAVRLVGNLTGSGVTNNQQKDTVPPQPPVISAPVTATNSAQLPVQGVGEPQAQVVVVLNSQEITRQPIDDNGEFKVTVPLTEGENALTLYSVDQAGNESVKTQSYTITLDTQNPTITLTQPQDGQTIELRKNQLTDIKGKTEAGAQVLINNRLVYATATGDFTLRYQLAEGQNPLHIVVIDKAGNQSTKDLTVTFKF